MKNFKISKKLIIAFSAVGIMLGITIITAIVGFSIIGKNFSSFYEGPYEVTTEAMNQKRAIQAVGKNINYAFSVSDKEKTKQYVEAAKQEIETMKSGVEFFRKKYKGDQIYVETLDKSMTAGTDAKEQIFALALENQNDEAKDIYFNTYLPYLMEADKNLTKIQEDTEARAASTYNQSNQAKSFVLILMCCIGILSVIITIAFALYIIRNLVPPIKELENASKSLKRGDLDITIDYESKDELGSLSSAFKETCSFLKTIISDLNYIINELANGNFSVTSTCKEEYTGSFTPLIEQLSQMMSNLSNTMNNIKSVSNQVSIGSSQMAENAQNLAEGATEQAGAIQELTATIAEIATASHEYEIQFSKAFNESQIYENEAIKGNEQMLELKTSMQRISEASKQIEHIISDIEDIASQTSLLSLNASIEAARAGEAGKGFAVVADQISKLADDSAKSAFQTRELIKNSLTEITLGNETTEKTSEALKGVITGINKLAGFVKEASTMSTTQAETMKQIELGIEQISIVVQSNSAAAEETSATSEELSAQAVTLNEQIDHFRLKE